MKTLLLLLLALAARAQTYTYTVGSRNLERQVDVTLRAGESLHIPATQVYTGKVTFEGTGQRIDNDGQWITTTVALPAGAVLTNRYLFNAERLRLAPGAAFHNQGGAYPVALDNQGTVQNHVGATLRVFGPARNAGTVRNAGTYLTKLTVPAPSGRVVASIAPPVVLAGFTATRAGATVQLAWHTTQEANVAQFVVERSGDGVVFVALTSVPATGAGAYAAADQRPGTVFYRVKVVNADGSYRYSPVAATGSK